MKQLVTFFLIALCWNTKAQSTLTIIPPDSSNHNYIYCSNTPYNFSGATVSTGTILTYGWECSPTANVEFNPSPANADTEAITFPNAGTYTLTFVAKTSSGIDSTNYTVTVVQTPTVNVTPPNPFVCSGGTTGIDLIASGALTYTWTNAPTLTYVDINADTVNVNPQTILSLPRTFNYSVTGTALDGCVSSQVVATVTVMAVPTPYFTAHPDTICVGQHAILCVDSMPVTTSYTWTANLNAGLGSTTGNCVQATPIYFNPANSQSDTIVYIQSLINIPGCPPYSPHTFYVIVEPLPHVQTTDTINNCNHTGDTLKAITVPTTNVSLTWVPKGSSITLTGLSSTPNEVFVNPTSQTMYYVTPINQFGCKGTKDSMLVLINNTSNCTESGISLYTTNNSITIYPNPATSSLQISLSDNSEKTTLIITDMLGNMVKQINVQNLEFTINVADLNEGVYNINLQTNEGIVNKHLIIVK